MISIPSGATLLLYTQPADMRKSFDGLSGIVRSELGREPDDGSLFLFINRRRDRIKVLYWDGGDDGCSATGDAALGRSAVAGETSQAACVWLNGHRPLWRLIPASDDVRSLLFEPY
jgi:hypothetical protein